MTKRWMLTGISMAMILAMPLGLLAQDAAPPATTVAVAPAAPVDVSVLLKAIPGDATAFAAIASLKQIDQHVQDAAKALSLPPNTIPPLTQWFKDSLRLGKSFNENGSIAVVILNATQATKPEDLQTKLVVLFPASDPKALAEEMGGTAEGDTFKLDLAGEASVAAPKGDFLAIAQNAEAIKAITEAKADTLMKVVSAERQKLFAGQDVFAWANPRGVSKEVLDAVKAELDKGMAVAGAPPGAMSGILDQLNTFIEQAQEFSFGLSLDAKRGITINVSTNMRPESDLGKEVAAMKPAAGPILAGLPGDAFILAGGMVGTHDSERLLKTVLDSAMGAESTLPKEKADQIRDGILRMFATSLEQFAVGVYGLPVEDGQGMVNVTVVAQVKDSDAWKQDAKKLAGIVRDTVGETVQKEGKTEDEVKQVAEVFTWKDNAEKLGGVDVDQFVIDITKMPGARPEEADQVKKIIGPDGLTVRVAAVGKDKVLVTIGGGAKKFEAAAKLVAAGEAPLKANASVKTVADRLPAGGRLAEGYLNVDKLISLAMDISSETGGGVMFPINLQNAAPIALTVIKNGETGVQKELLIPMELLRSGMDVVRPMLMMGINQPPPSEPNEPQSPGDNSGIK